MLSYKILLAWVPPPTPSSSKLEKGELTGASPLHLGEELLFDGVHELGTEVAGVEHDLMVH